jgi:D-glycero-alpha-D-manno-heptose-7-phosphate kinase
MPAFFEKQAGAVVSFAIDKYIYISVNPKFNGRTRVSYSETEDVEKVSHLKHDLARETLGHFTESGLEITSVSDIPDGGSGLGSSSSYAVGLAMALTAGFRATEERSVLVEDAYYIERKLCEHPCGKQDHYAAGYGGLNFFKFFRDGTVAVEALPLMAGLALEQEMMLFFVGSTRISTKILKAQESNIRHKPASFLAAIKLRDLAIKLRGEIVAGHLENIGEILDTGWRYKKQMAEGITEGWIDDLYEKAKAAGATGGKLLGAGGGGFFLFAVPESRRADVTKALGLRHVPFEIDMDGCKVIYDDGRQKMGDGGRKDE